MQVISSEGKVITLSRVALCGPGNRDNSSLIFLKLQEDFLHKVGLALKGKKNQGSGSYFNFILSVAEIRLHKASKAPLLYDAIECISLLLRVALWVPHRCSES